MDNFPFCLPYFLICIIKLVLNLVAWASAVAMATDSGAEDEYERERERDSYI